MINLLPQKEKQELLFLKNRNLIIVLGSVTVIFLICLSLVFLSLKFYILQEVGYEKSILAETEKEYQTDSFMTLLNSIKQYNRSMSRADSFYKQQVYFSDVVKRIIGVQRPQGLNFSNIVLEKVAKNSTIKANIYGTSPSRDALLSFKEDVEKQEKVENVYLPPDNLIKPTNISFNLSFEISSK